MRGAQDEQDAERGGRQALEYKALVHRAPTGDGVMMEGERQESGRVHLHRCFLGAGLLSFPSHSSPSSTTGVYCPVLCKLTMSFIF